MFPVQLVLGLGNPGPRYAGTRHNAGFRVVDELAGRAGIGDWEPYILAHLVSLKLGDGVIAAKPMTYMNRSGAALGWLLERFALEPEQVLVVVDDIDLPLGRLRLRRSGGPGTHNGLRDLCDVAGKGYPRLRVGVRGEEPWDDLAAWVTSGFAPDERDAVEDAVARAADAVEAVVADGIDAAMNRFNRVESEE
ncbi:MAG: aminoacyl-tRNA hydrolase [Thermoanaerobaculales bacterium]|nr:aminoacyl-tRNA hydrolase [Thermoanaerobaculales bacterium]